MDSFENTLRKVLLSLLSPDNNTRNEGERYVKASEGQPGFTLAILNLVKSLSASQDAEDVAVRQSAAVLFKNTIKKRWQVDEDEKENTIPDGDRETLKMHLIDLMCVTPPDVQKQLAEAVTIISKYDFPAKWDGLLGQLVNKIQSKELHIIKGVMLTANSIMKRFRYVFKTDILYEELSYCLKHFQSPLLMTYQFFGELVASHPTDKLILISLFETLRLMSRIFFSLNWQDIPEFFEDHLNDWMTEFAKYLTYTNPILVDTTEETEPGVIEQLQAAIVENLVLYVTKYEEEFAAHLPQFTQIIWELLLKVGTQPKYDNLATSAIKFLTSVSSKQMNIQLFNDTILQQIIEHIVVPNLSSTENDEELFESNPTDYIQKDMEGSDQDTRRRAACELVRSLLKFFAPITSQYCVRYIDVLLTEYNKTRSWKPKDTALNLVLAVAVMNSNTGQGAGELNPNVNILEIFGSHVLPEVYDQNVNKDPIVKADAIKLVCIFRSHLDASFMMTCLPHLVRYLTSDYVVVQTYAAICIERFLSVKDKDPHTNRMIFRFTADSLSPLLNGLFTGLFQVMNNPELPENDYVMKCIMRVLIIMDTAVAPVLELILQQLTTALQRVCKNPANPHFNHYLFECLALLVRSSCSTASNMDPVTASARMETLLFPPFQLVLSQDIVEFVPYVFQVLAQLLYFRPKLAHSGLSEAYLSLFPPLLSPVLWERKGNIPALIELMKAYISRGSAEIVSGNHLTAVLGIFQKMLASKLNQTYAFHLLETLISYTPQVAIEPYLRTILELLLRRLMENKTPNFMRQTTQMMLLMSAMYGGSNLYQLIESIQSSMTNMLITQVWTQVAENSAHIDAHIMKQMVVGATKLLCETAIAQDPQLWGVLLRLTVSLLDGGKEKADSGLEDMLEEENREFDSTYSRLAYAQVPDAEPTEEMKQAPQYFATSLAALCKTHPGAYTSVIHSVLDDQGKKVLQNVISQTGVVLG